VAAAFWLRQQFDDAVGDDESVRRRRLREIIDRCTAADQRLDAEADAFDRLQAMERDVEQLTQWLGAQRGELAGRLPAAQATLDQLRGRYAGSALIQVDGNVSEAAARIAFAGVELDRAAAALAGVLPPGTLPPATQPAGGSPTGEATADELAAEALPAGEAELGALAGGVTSGGAGPGVSVGDRATARPDRARTVAALACRGAQQALGQAVTLLEALTRAEAELAAALATADELVVEARAEAASGRAALAADGSLGEVDRVRLTAAVGKVEQVADDVQAGLAANRPDPLLALRRIEAAVAELGQAMGGTRDASAAFRQARALLEQAMAGARTSIDGTGDFITTRRGAVGSAARTRLAAAKRQLDQAVALSAEEPAAALAAAQQAQRLADEAMTVARIDVERWTVPGEGAPGVPGGYAGSLVLGRPTAGAGGFGGAVLGGILLGSVLARGQARMGGALPGGPLGLVSGASTDPPAAVGPPSSQDRPPLAESAPDARTPGETPGEPGRFGGPSTWARHFDRRRG
jgi:hypothetical protein